MKKVSFSILLVATSFAFGFAFKSMLVNQSKVNGEIKRVTGIGGIFFKCKDPAVTREWYKNHLDWADGSQVIADLPQYLYLPQYP